MVESNILIGIFAVKCIILSIDDGCNQNGRLNKDVSDENYSNKNDFIDASINLSRNFLNTYLEVKICVAKKTTNKSHL